MTRDELIKYFSHRRYDGDREDIYRVMLEHPEITEPYPIIAAAGEISDCRLNGVELSVEDALRLTAGEEEVPMEKLIKEMDAAGITSDNIIDKLIDMTKEDYGGCEPSAKAERQMEFLNKYADELASGNRDIIVTARPEFFRYASYATLFLAVLSPELTKREQNIIQIMKTLSDGARIFREKNYIKLVFYIRNIWQEP